MAVSVTVSPEEGVLGEEGASSPWRSYLLSEVMQGGTGGPEVEATQLWQRCYMSAGLETQEQNKEKNQERNFQRGPENFH